MSELPLSGVRVVDLTRALAGPFCTSLLGDFGADVVKVEGLPLGDATRHWPPFNGARSLYFLSTNRNKRSIALDLRTPEAKSILSDLVADADVLVENFRPGVLTKLGLDPARLRQERPDLVISSISGFGEVGPMSQDVGLDQVAQGMAGLMSVTGAGDQTPMRVGIPVVDLAAGMLSAFGVAASLAGRAHNGRASRVNASLLESAISMMTFQAQRYLSLGEVPDPQGNDHPLISPYGTFQASDGSLNVAVGSQAQWVSLCDVLGSPELASRPEYAEPAQRTHNRRALSDELNALFMTRPADDWMAALRQVGVPCGPVYAMDEVFADAQVQALGMVRTVGEGPEADVLLRGPLWVDEQASGITRRPPLLGEHSREVLHELGYVDDLVDNLVRRGVVGTADRDIAAAQSTAEARS
ncbi:CaiB/BaiF CoA transferase family protein [Angustibacter luteus]|uniref:CaiB/BaiF CoA transferase family protein n=1 Tax=Angustibacter luteus TaxID=658456 RepID=A0ABW1JF07_9ACTN